MMLKRLSNIVVCFIVLMLPLSATAQLSSTNYQVVKYSLGGSGQSVNATSTNYQMVREPGGLYTLASTSATSTEETGGGGGDDDEDPPPEDPPPVDPPPEDPPPVDPPPVDPPPEDPPPTGEDDPPPTEDTDDTEVDDDDGGSNGGRDDDDTNDEDENDSPLPATTTPTEPNLPRTPRAIIEDVVTHIGSTGRVVRERVVKTVDAVVERVAKTVPEPVKVVTREAAEVAPEIGVGGGILVSLLTSFQLPLSFTNIGRLLVHGWNSLLGLFVFWRRRRAWGTVYDSVTKVPLDPAFVEIFDASGEPKGEAITDLDGRYGFVVPEGMYTMNVRKSNYTFPAKHRVSVGRDVLYDDLYYGGLFKVTGAVAHDIPMDPIEFDWNQYEKLRTKQTKFIHRFDPILAKTLDYTFFVGSIAVIWQFYSNFGWYSGAIFVLYVLLVVLRLFRGGPVLYGTLTKGGHVLPFAVVRVYQQDHEIASKVTDETGRYAIIVPPGRYTIVIEERIDEAQYQAVATKTIKTNKGIINSTMDIPVDQVLETPTAV